MDISQTPPPVNVCQLHAFEKARVYEQSGLTRSLSPDVQVARLAVALLVQCFAVGEPKEPTARCSYCCEDGIAASIRGLDRIHVVSEGCLTYPRKDIVKVCCYGWVGWFRWIGSTTVCKVSL